jgi:hypothetical protein
VSVSAGEGDTLTGFDNILHISTAFSDKLFSPKRLYHILLKLLRHFKVL